MGSAQTSISELATSLVCLAPDAVGETSARPFISLWKARLRSGLARPSRDIWRIAQFSILSWCLCFVSPQRPAICDKLDSSSEGHPDVRSAAQKMACQDMYGECGKGLASNIAQRCAQLAPELGVSQSIFLYCERQLRC